MHKNRFYVAASIVGGLTCLTGTAHAQGNACAAAKLKAAGAKATCALGLESKESKTGVEEDER